MCALAHVLPDYANTAKTGDSHSTTDKPCARMAILTKSAKQLSIVRDCFQHDGIAWVQFDNEINMVRSLRNDHFDLCIIDASSMPMFGSTLLRWNEYHSMRPIPFLMIGGPSSSSNILNMIEAGISDVVKWPIDKQELYVRVHLALKRARKSEIRSNATLSVGPYFLDRNRHLLTLNGSPVELTSREFALAWHFFSNANVTISRQQIACAVWGNKTDVVDRTLEQHIYKLRKKLCLNSTEGIQLRAFYALGYKLEVTTMEDMVAALRRPSSPTTWQSVA